MLAACASDRSAYAGALRGHRRRPAPCAASGRLWGMDAVPVAAGGGDNAAGAVGVGVVSDGDALLSLGTSGVIFVATGSFRPNPARAVHAFCHCLPGMWHQMSVHLSAASCIDWVVRLTGIGSPPRCLRARRRRGQAAGPNCSCPTFRASARRTTIRIVRGGFLDLDHETDAGRLCAGRAGRRGLRARRRASRPCAKAGADVQSFPSSAAARARAIGGGSSPRRSMYLGLSGGRRGRPRAGRSPPGPARRGRGCACDDLCARRPSPMSSSPMRTLRARLGVKRERFRAAYRTRARRRRSTMTPDYFAAFERVRFKGPDAGKISPIAGTTRTASCSASGWRSICALRSASGTASAGRAATCLARARSIALGTPAPTTRGRRAKARGGTEFCRKARRAVLLLPRCRCDGRGTTPQSLRRSFAEAVDDLEKLQAKHGRKLLWGTANLFSHPRYMAGAATNPDPEVFAWAAAAGARCARSHASPGRRQLRAVGRARRL